MYAVGHLALGYITGKAAGKLLTLEVNVPLLLLASIISDFDLLIPGLEHRGPTHSFILLTLLFLPLFIIYGKKVVPYFVALVQHSLVGDYVTGGVQLLWPLTTHIYGVVLEATSITAVVLEWVFFLASLAIMLKMKDLQMLLQRHPSNLLLSVPIATVLLPTIAGFPLSVPPELVVPHLIYLTLFTVSILLDFKYVLRKT
jgi:membrane-bound metal-dependent hydrolase YbcI (DUF457 family)